jgi:hypothetical protein
MTPIPEVAAVLAGFVLAHAAWSVSDLPNAEGLVPLAVVVEHGERRLLRFQAETQEQAIAKGKVGMREAMTAADAWAFARDGLIEHRGQKRHGLTVEFWAKGMTAPAVLVQEYEPLTASSKFRIIDDPMIVVTGVRQTPADVADVLKSIRAGIASHPKVASLWNSWR